MSDKLFKERLSLATKEVEAAVEEAVARRGSPRTVVEGTGGSTTRRRESRSPNRRSSTAASAGGGLAADGGNGRPSSVSSRLVHNVTTPVGAPPSNGTGAFQWDSRPDVMPWPTTQELRRADAAVENALTSISATTSRLIRTGQRSETELKQKIQALEDTVADYERQKFNVMGTFAEYRERVAEREQNLEAEYSSKIISLSEEVLGAKKDFENRMKQFQALQEKFEREKEAALEKLRQEHQREIQTLEQRCSESQLLNLEQKYMLEIQRLEEERKSLKSEKERLGGTFESKLRRAQTLYETELTSAKALYTKELEALQDHEEALKEELLARQEDFKDRMEELQRQFRQSKEELNICKQEVEALERRLKLEESNVASMSDELKEARAETNDALSRLNDVKDDLDATKKRCKQQEQEVLRKSNMLERLELAKTKLEEVIQDLHQEVKSLKSKVEFLENERQNLQMQSESQAQLQSSQVKALEAVLETVSNDKETTKEHFDQQVELERKSAGEREHAMRKEYGNKLNELEQQHADLKDQFEAKLDSQTDLIRRQLEVEYERRLLELRTENENLEMEVDTLRTKLHSALVAGGDDDALKNIVHKEIEAKDAQLKAGRVQMNELIAKTGQLHRELDEARTELSNRQETIQDLQKQLEKEANDAAVECDFHAYHQEEIAKLTLSLEAEIKDKFREKIQSHPELSVELLQEKDAEIEQLKEKLATLQSSFDDAAGIQSVEFEKIIEEQRSKIEQLERELGEASTVDESARSGLNEKQEIIEKLTNELDDSKHQLDEAQTKMESELAALKAQIDAKEQQDNQYKETLERDLRSKFAESAAENHVIEEQAFEKQLQLVKEDADAKERAQESRVSELESSLEHKEEQIEGLQQRVKELMDEVDGVAKELDKKTDELKTFSKKTDEYIRRREQQQAAAHERKMKNLKTEHDRLSQQLADREHALQTELKDIQEKYNRLLEETTGGGNSDRCSNDSSVDSGQLEQLQDKLKEKQNEIELLREKYDLLAKGMLTSSQPQLTTAQPSSPPVAMSNTKRFLQRPQQPPEKRQSLCGDPHEGHMCRRAANMAAYSKWHSLVDKVKNADRNNGGEDRSHDSPRPSTSFRRPLTRSNNNNGGGDAAKSTPVSPANSDTGAQSNTTADTASANVAALSDQDTCHRLLSPGFLTDVEAGGEDGGGRGSSRRQSSSPAPRPAFLPKGTTPTGGAAAVKVPLPIDKRPAWRF